MSRHFASDPLQRLAALLDPGSAVPFGEPEQQGVRAALGEIDGRPALAFATDPRLRGGSLTVADCDAIIDAHAEAVRRGLPIVGLWHSGGAGLAEGARTMDGVARLMRAITLASGLVPQVSVVLGPCAGAAAYASLLTDIVVMTPTGRLVVTGPDVVASLTGEDVTLAELGGPDTHAEQAGTVHVLATDEPDAFAATRALVGLLAAAGETISDVVDQPLPRAGERRDVVRALVDADTWVELQPRWATALVTGLGRLGGRTVGVLANDPGHTSGWLDADATDKAAGFVGLCERFAIPLVVLADVPGILPGLAQERAGALRRGAALFRTLIGASVPRVTVVTGRAYGGAFLAMNAKGLGATRVLAWPEADLGVMPAEAAVRVLYRRELAALAEQDRPHGEAELIAAHARELGGVAAALEAGAVDEVIAPEHTRVRVAAILADSLR